MNPEAKMPLHKEVTRKWGFLFLFSCVLLLIIFVGSVIHFETVKNRYKSRLKVLESSYFSKQKDFDRINSVKEKRAQTVANVYLRSFPSNYAFAVADFMRRLSLIVPSEIRLVSLDVIASLQTFDFVMVGFASESTKGPDLQALVARLQELEKISKINLKYTQSQHRLSLISGVEFIISGEVDLN